MIKVRRYCQALSGMQHKFGAGGKHQAHTVSAYSDIGVKHRTTGCTSVKLHNQIIAAAVD